MPASRPTTRFMGAAHVRVPSPPTASEKATKRATKKKAKNVRLSVTDDEGTEVDVAPPKPTKKARSRKTSSKNPDVDAMEPNVKDPLGHDIPEADVTDPETPKKPAAKGRKGLKGQLANNEAPAATVTQPAPNAKAAMKTRPLRPSVASGDMVIEPEFVHLSPSSARSYSEVLSPDGKAVTRPMRPIAMKAKPGPRGLIPEVVIPLRRPVRTVGSVPGAAAMAAAMAPSGPAASAAAKAPSGSTARTLQVRPDVAKEPLGRKLRNDNANAIDRFSRTVSPSPNRALAFVNRQDECASQIGAQMIAAMRHGPPPRRNTAAIVTTQGMPTLLGSAPPRSASGAPAQVAYLGGRTPTGPLFSSPPANLAQELFPSPARPQHSSPEASPGLFNPSPDPSPDPEPFDIDALMGTASEDEDEDLTAVPYQHRASSKRSREVLSSPEPERASLIGSPAREPPPKKTRTASADVPANVPSKGKAPEVPRAPITTNPLPPTTLKIGKLSNAERAEFAKERDRILAYCKERGRRPETVFKAMGLAYGNKRASGPHPWNMYCMWRRLDGKPTSPTFLAEWADDYHAELEQVANEDGVTDPAALEAWLEAMKEDLHEAGKLDEAESDPVKRMTNALSDQRELCNSLALSEDVFVLSLVVSVDEVAAQLNSLVLSSDALRLVVDLHPVKIRKAIASIAAATKNLQDGVVDAEAIDLSGLLPVTSKAQCGETTAVDLADPPPIQDKKTGAKSRVGKSKSIYPKPGDLRIRSKEHPNGPFWAKQPGSRGLRDSRRRTFRTKTVCDLAVVIDVPAISRPWDAFPRLLAAHKARCRDWPLGAGIPGIDWNASTIQTGVPDDIQVAVGTAWEEEDHSEGAHPWFEVWSADECEIAIDDPRYLDIPIVFSWDPSAKADVVRLTVRSSREARRAQADKITKDTMADAPPLARVRAIREIADAAAPGPQVPDAFPPPVPLPRKSRVPVRPLTPAPEPLEDVPTLEPKPWSVDSLDAAVKALRRPNPQGLTPAAPAPSPPSQQPTYYPEPCPTPHAGSLLQQLGASAPPQSSSGHGLGPVNSRPHAYSSSLVGGTRLAFQHSEGYHSAHLGHQHSRGGVPILSAPTHQGHAPNAIASSSRSHYPNLPSSYAAQALDYEYDDDMENYDYE